MSKFKVGDRVRLTGEAWSIEDHGVTAGDVVTVVSEDPEGGGFDVGGEDWTIHQRGQTDEWVVTEESA